MDFTDEYNADDAIVLRDHLLDLGHDPSRGLLLIVTTHLTEKELI